MLELQALPNKVSEKFNRSETFSDIDAEFRLEDAQKVCSKTPHNPRNFLAAPFFSPKILV
ncbi:MAG: hypothetical protein V8R07_04910 [Bacteroides fragilis]